MPTQNLDTATTLHQRLRIGEWLAELTTNELRRGSETVRLEPKAMEVLMLLADRAGGVVSREELFSAVWPGVVVGDEALTQCIIKLRRALGDDARAPSYIETISKRGYRLIAKVEPDDAVSAPPAVGPGPSPQARRRIPWLVVSALVVFAAIAMYLHLSPPAPLPGTDDVPIDDMRSSITVTVLPFEWLGADDEQGYLARGISDDLITELSRLPNLRLIRASSPKSSTEADRRPRYLVSGSVQRAAGTLRINIRLVDTDSNQQLWSERFERPFGDLFAVQDEMVRRLAELLPGKLSDATRQRLAKRHTASLEAYDYFLRGQARFLVRQAEDNDAARELYRKALELDPKFARAYAGLAMTYAMDYRLRPSRDRSVALDRAVQLADTALGIDPELPEVHWALGLVHVQARRHEQAMGSLKRAIELDRSYADAYALIGGIHTYIGEPGEAIRWVRTAMRLNPGGSYLYFQILGRAYLFSNDVEQALINLREAHARNPIDLETRVYLAAALVASGDRAGAEWVAEEIRAMEPGFSVRTWLESYPLNSNRHRERLVDLLAKVGL